MGAPTSKVGYTSATTRRGDHVVCMDMWWHWKKTVIKHERAVEMDLYIYKRLKTVLTVSKF
jgi:hypothetical protein